MVFSDITHLVAILNKPGHKLHGHPARVLEDNEMVQTTLLEFTGEHRELFNTPEIKEFYREDNGLGKYLSDTEKSGPPDIVPYAVRCGMNPGKFKREFREIFGRKMPFRVTLKDYLDYVSRKINRYS